MDRLNHCDALTRSLFPLSAGLTAVFIAAWISKHFQTVEIIVVMSRQKTERLEVIVCKHGVKIHTEIKPSECRCHAKLRTARWYKTHVHSVCPAGTASPSCMSPCWVLPADTKVQPMFGHFKTPQILFSYKNFKVARKNRRIEAGRYGKKTN